METCTLEPDYLCNCTDGFIGKNCTEVVSFILVALQWIILHSRTLQSVPIS